MNKKCFQISILLCLVLVIEPTSAQSEFRASGGPGEMRAIGNITASRGGLVDVYYFLAFKLAEESDGIFPASEQVEIEIPGESAPDGSQSPAFVISIPPGSFQRNGDRLESWNPVDIEIRQQHGSDAWQFVGPDGVTPGSTGVIYFWAFIRDREADEVMDLGVRMLIRDNRNTAGAMQAAPQLLELMFGGPTLRIGNDTWQTQIRRTGGFAAGPRAASDQ